MRAAVCAIEGKGGVGKSTTSAIAIEALRQDGKRSVTIVDGDTTNSSMVSMFDDVVSIDMAEAEAGGELAALFKGVSDFLVADFGARSEAKFLDPILPRLLRTRSKSEPSLVVLRPLTLSSFVQNNTVAFIEKTAPLGVKTILVRNLSQGRTPAHFSDWVRSQGRRRALGLGAREVDLSDAGVCQRRSKSRPAERSKTRPVDRARRHGKGPDRGPFHVGEDFRSGGRDLAGVGVDAFGGGLVLLCPDRRAPPPDGLLEAVAVAVHGQDADVVSEPVQQGAGEPL